jgi:phage terminase large subunit
MVCHRRAGKTIATVNDIVSRALYASDVERPRYAYIAPYYSQAKQIAWDYLKHYTRSLALKTSESSLSVDLVTGARISLYGADNPDSFRGLYFDGGASDEFGDTKPNLFPEIIRPALADRRGWWVFIGTPNGPNHFHEMWEKAVVDPTWHTTLLKASETHIIPDEELADMRRTMTDDEYESEMECSWFASVRGAYYGQEVKAARVGAFPPVKGVPCHYVFDLGFTDSTAIWRWQEFPDHILVSLSVEWDGRPVQFYTDWLHGQRTAGFTMGNVWLPPDAKAKTLQTGRSTVEQFVSNGIRPRLLPNLSVQDGIQAARLFFRNAVFDDVGCTPGLKALKTYRRKWDPDNKVFLDTPLHNWASNYADSFRYMALVAKLATPAQSAEVQSHRVAMYSFTLDQAWECRDGPSSRRY